MEMDEHFDSVRNAYMESEWTLTTSTRAFLHIENRYLSVKTIII